MHATLSLVLSDLGWKERPRLLAPAVGSGVTSTSMVVLLLRYWLTCAVQIQPQYMLPSAFLLVDFAVARAGIGAAMRLTVATSLRRAQSAPTRLCEQYVWRICGVWLRLRGVYLAWLGKCLWAICTRVRGLSFMSLSK